MTNPRRPGPSASSRGKLSDIIEVFVEGVCAGRSRTHPFESHRVGDLWVLRDAPRRNPRDLRLEEWVACGQMPARVDAVLRREAQGRCALSAISRDRDDGEKTRDAYKQLGYRLLRTEPLFVHRLRRIPAFEAPVEIVRVDTPELAARFGVATRTRPMKPELLAPDAPQRQYVALDGKAIVGWVRSVDTTKGTWVADMKVIERCRRRGIARAMLSRLLRDDRSLGSRMSVLTASHTGALLYPHVGYEQVGILWLFMPGKDWRTRGGS